MGEDFEEKEIEYTKSEDQDIIYANGVFGGVTPRGDLSMDLILDYQKLPKKEKYKITEEGSLGEITEKEGGEKLLRETQATLFLNLNSGLSIATWMLGKIISAIKEGTVTEEQVRELIEKEYDLVPERVE